MDDIILQTKLHIPASPPALVPRPRLIQVLNAAHADRLTLISAPAGFGKTTLATTWLRQQNAAVAWLSLDAHDNDLHRFLTYLTAAVHGALPAFEPEQRLPPADPDPAVEPLLTSLINQLAAHNRQVILVLDDYHLITANEVHAALSFLLDNAPSTLHVLLTTRADPPLPLARLRARGHLTELRAADLMFSPEETTVLLNGRHALDLSTPDLHVLNNRTEGWAAALQLAVLSLQRLPPSARHDFIANFAGDDRYIFDYLIAEVLQQQTPQRQKFLLQTCILTELSAELSAAVTALPQVEAQAMLQALEHENLFLIPLDNRREWYRYHALFADLLRSRLAQLDPQAQPQLHRRAAVWYAGHNRLDRAIPHSLAAGDLDRAARFLQAPDLLRHASPTQIFDWLDEIPAPIRAAHPRLSIMHLWVLLEAGRLAEVETRLAALEEAVATDPQLAEDHLLLRIHLARHRRDPAQAIALSRELLALLPDRPTSQSLSVQLGAVFGLAEAYRLAGNTPAAEAQFTAAIRLSEDAHSPDFALRARLGLAQLLVARQAWDAAAPALEEILAAAGDTHPLVAAEARRLLNAAPSHSTKPTLEVLTAREQEVLRWLDGDLTTAEIADHLFVSTNTVKTHLKRIYAKLGARSRYEAVAVAKERGFL